VLRIVAPPASAGAPDTDADRNPFVAYRGRMAWYAFAVAHGMEDADTVALVRETDAAVAAVAGNGFVTTPLWRADALSDALGFSAAGGVWVKDETGAVAGSHKGRHLLAILLHLLAAERLGVRPRRPRPPLAIASCGNAALAAATLAAAVDWPVSVFVPPNADPWVLARLRRLGATVVACPRSTGEAGGDPCVAEARAAVDHGAVPFTVQGPDNALCLDGGRTLGWELADAAPTGGVRRVFVQAGGGALATCVGDALVGSLAVPPRVHVVQTESCAPLARAWEGVKAIGLADACRRWAECMWPWEGVPTSAATGILDDETYDWIGAAEAMAATGGAPVVAPESEVRAAHALAVETTGVPVDATGSAGLAGLLTARRRVDAAERVMVLFTGRTWPSAG
jgi:threonine synthase